MDCSGGLMERLVEWTIWRLMERLMEMDCSGG